MEKEKLTKEFRELSEPLVKFLRKNYHPRARIIIDCESAEVVEGDMAEQFNY